MKTPSSTPSPAIAAFAAWAAAHPDVVTVISADVVGDHITILTSDGIIRHIPLAFRNPMPA